MLFLKSIYPCLLISHFLIRLRLHPASPRTDRIAIEDDVIPLSKPIIGPNGEKINSIAVKAGQVGPSVLRPILFSS